MRALDTTCALLTSCSPPCRRSPIFFLHSLRSHGRGEPPPAKKAKSSATTAGLEPARVVPSRFRVYRLNRSATLSIVHIAQRATVAVYKVLHK